MSLVTNAILAFPCIEDDADRLRDVNQFFDDGVGFVSVDDEKLERGWYGGTKFLECNIAIGAFNYLHLDELCRHLASIKWVEPDRIQLIVKEQEDECFRIIYPASPISDSAP